MPLRSFFEPTPLIQTIVLALSIFNLVAFLWLSLTVWLNGDRRSGIARLGVVGLGLSAFFFYIHALLISSPLTQTPRLIPLDVLWRLLWLPLLGVPYIWFAIGLHYAALINTGWRRRRPLLLVISGILGCVVFLLLMLHQSTFTFIGTLQLLSSSDPLDTWEVTKAVPTLPLVLIPVLFLCYVTFCAIGPWFTPGRVKRLLGVLWHTSRHTSLRHALADAFWDDPPELERLEEPMLSWYLARPRMFVAALLMVALTTTLGILGIWSMVDWLELQQRRNPPLPVSLPASPTLSSVPLNLLVLDMFATGAVALIILLVGYSIVRHGILIERPLSRRGFFEQWRGTVIVATAVAIFIALLVMLTRSNLGGLLLITLLATVAYALFTWSSYTAHDRYLLGPFLRSTNLRHWLNTDLQRTEQGLEDLFVHLCEDVLAVECARLVVMAGQVRRSFSYRWPGDAWVGKSTGIPMSPPASALVGALGGDTHPYSGRPHARRVQMTVNRQAMICWVLPIYDELGLVATLYLGPRQDGAVFTDEDMDLAHACGQRILDTLSDHEAMQAVAGLLRRRIVDVKLLGAQQRRVLHDEILPQMHLALLRLETLRSLTNTELADKSAVGAINRPRRSTHKGYPYISDWQALDEAVGMISDAHRRLAAMMRATAPGAPHRLEHEGLMNAIRTMLEQDFQQAFDEIEWHVSEEMAGCIDEATPPAIAELVFAAVQEALRNAARHARGSDVHRRLRVILTASCDPHLEVVVADDGVGIASATSSTTSTGGGLLTHSALLAIAGGSLTVKSAPGEGVTVRILLPTE